MQIWMSCLGKTKSSMVKQPGGGGGGIHQYPSLPWIGKIHLIQPRNSFRTISSFLFQPFFFVVFSLFILEHDFDCRLCGSSDEHQKTDPAKPALIWVREACSGYGRRWEVGSFSVLRKPINSRRKDFEESGCPATLSSCDLFEMVSEFR